MIGEDDALPRRGIYHDPYGDDNKVVVHAFMMNGYNGAASVIVELCASEKLDAYQIGSLMDVSLDSVRLEDWLNE